MAWCEDDTPENRTALEALFDGLKGTRYRVKSNETSSYNCIAFASGDTGMLWDYRHEPYTYWPRRGVPRDGSVSSMIKLFEQQGYSPCADGAYENGIEKIAIYGFEDQWRHTAIQLENGLWASKLGGLQDIEHVSPDDVNHPDYGKVVQFMARPRSKKRR